MTNQEAVTPCLSSLSDEELLKTAYSSQQVLSPLEIELAARLEHALDALTYKPVGVGDVVTRKLLQQELE